MPTMLVRGMLSDVVTDEGVDDLLSRLPDATVVDVDGAAHMIAGDRNDAFSEAVIGLPRGSGPADPPLRTSGARRRPGTGIDSIGRSAERRGRG